MTEYTGAVDVRRPTSVTVAVVLTWVAALLDVGGAAALWWLARDDEVTDALGVGSQEARWLALTLLAVGLVVAALASALGRGWRPARALVSAVMVARAGVAMLTLVRFGSHQLSEALVGIVVSAFVLALLWNADARAWFGR